MIDFQNYDEIFNRNNYPVFDNNRVARNIEGRNRKNPI